MSLFKAPVRSTRDAFRRFFSFQPQARLLFNSSAIVFQKLLNTISNSRGHTLNLFLNYFQRLRVLIKRMSTEILIASKHAQAPSSDFTLNGISSANPGITSSLLKLDFNGMRFLPLLAVCGLMLISSGCGRDNEIQVYRISKESDASETKMSNAPFANMGSMPGLAADSPAASAGNKSPIHWSSPDSWTEKPASGMRMGSFQITGPEDTVADLSIIPLSGPAGGLVSNINRWRRQDVMLPEITEADVDQIVTELETQLGAMKLIDMVSEEALIDGKFKQRVLAAIFMFEGQTWFVKVKGPAELLEAQKETFFAFLKSFHDGTDHDH